MKRSLVCVLLVMGLLFVGMKAVSAGQIREAETVTYVVKPGDNLWKIAQRVDPEGDNRETVQVILELNDLGTAGVVPGQPLRLPRV